MQASGDSGRNRIELLNGDFLFPFGRLPSSTFCNPASRALAQLCAMLIDAKRTGSSGRLFSATSLSFSFSVPSESIDTDFLVYSFPLWPSCRTSGSTMAQQCPALPCRPCMTLVQTNNPSLDMASHAILPARRSSQATKSGTC